MNEQETFCMHENLAENHGKSLKVEKMSAWKEMSDMQQKIGIIAYPVHHHKRKPQEHCVVLPGLEPV